MPMIFDCCGALKASCGPDPLWERACPRWHHRALPARPYRLHRRQASSHKFCGALKPEAGLPRCGSGLARDGITALCLLDPIARIAGEPAPTGSTAPRMPDTKNPPASRQGDSIKHTVYLLRINDPPPRSPPTPSANAQTAGRTAHALSLPTWICQ